MSVGQSVGVAVAFSAGLFSFLSPCVLPLFPSYLSFITGMSVADLSAELSPAVRRRVMVHSIVFVLGFSLVFVGLSEKPAGYVGTLLVGVTFAIGWTPCVGPILGAILSLAGTAETVTRGVGLLVAYSAGLGLPFLLSAVALGSFLKFFKRYRPFIPTVERVAGVLLVLVGVLVITNKYVVLNAWAVSLTPEWLLKRL